MKPIQSKPMLAPPPPPHKFSKIFCLPEMFLDIISENVEKIFFTENEVHRDDPKTYSEVISDINFEK